MQVKGEIINFISTAENNGALLITDEWGCGKSYLIKQIADELNEKEEFLLLQFLCSEYRILRN